MHRTSRTRPGDGQRWDQKIIMPELSSQACFGCRKVFKKPHWYETKRTPVPPKYSCPECGAIMMAMGYKFRAPKQDDVKSWDRIRHAIETGTPWEIRTIKKEEKESQPHAATYGSPARRS